MSFAADWNVAVVEAESSELNSKEISGRLSTASPLSMAIVPPTAALELSPHIAAMSFDGLLRGSV